MASFDVFDRRGGGGVEVTVAQSRGAIDQGESAPKGKESRSAVSEGREQRNGSRLHVGCSEDRYSSSFPHLQVRVQHSSFPGKIKTGRIQYAYIPADVHETAS